MNGKYTLHSITIENDEQEVFETFNDNELDSYYDYMNDLNMDLSRDDDEGYYDEGCPDDYMKHIHVYFNVVLSDGEIHGLTEEQFMELKRESEPYHHSRTATIKPVAKRSELW